MTRVRARWAIGLGLVISGAAISCGSGDSAGLFTMSTAGAGIGLGSSGASHQAGAPNVAGDDSGGAFNQAGGAGAGDTSGAPGAGMSSTGGGGSGAPAGGAMGSAGKGGSTGKAGSGGGGAGAGGKSGGGGTAGAPSGGAGAGGAMAGAAGNGGTSGGSGSGGTAGSAGSGPVSCSDNAGCGESQYCAKPDCSLGPTGTCTARPIDCNGTAETAMCGCDGFTYHDACLMHLNSQNSFAAGACSKVGIGTGTAVSCSAANDAACTVKGGVCGFRADTACPAALPLKGICWVLPASCPMGGGTAKAAEVCNPVAQGPNSFCESECTAVKSQVRYALTAACN